MKPVKHFLIRIREQPPFIVEAKNTEEAKRKASYHKYVHNIKGTYKVKWIKNNPK